MAPRGYTVDRRPDGAVWMTPTPPQAPSPRLALDAIGLGSLSWQMTKKQMRAAYPSIGNAPNTRPFATEWELPDLTSAPYNFGGCEFVLHLEGWDDHPVYWDYRASSLLGVMLIYRRGPLRQCRHAIEAKLTTFLGRRPDRNVERHHLSWESSDGRRGYRNIDELIWRTEDASIVLDRVNLSIDLRDEVDDSPLVVGQLLTAVPVPQP
jgi:hypothetical protein